MNAVSAQTDMKPPCLWKIGLLFIGLVGIPVLAFWLGGRFKEGRNIREDYFSQGRFAQMETMLLAYHQEHGAFPPTKYQRAADEPVHSWRVLLASEYLVAAQVKYDFTQPWNSSTNLQALAGKPFRYFTMEDDAARTDFLAIGDGDAWPSQKPLRSLLVTRGKDRFLLVEYPDSDIHWMEPKY